MLSASAPRLPRACCCWEANSLTCPSSWRTPMHPLLMKCSLADLDGFSLPRSLPYTHTHPPYPLCTSASTAGACLARAAPAQASATASSLLARLPLGQGPHLSSPSSLLQPAPEPGSPLHLHHHQQAQPLRPHATAALHAAAALLQAPQAPHPLGYLTHSFFAVKKCLEAFNSMAVCWRLAASRLATHDSRLGSERELHINHIYMPYLYGLQPTVHNRINRIYVCQTPFLRRSYGGVVYNP